MGMFVELPEEQPDYSSFKATIDPVVTPQPAPAPTPVHTQTMSVKEIVENTTGPNLDEISLTDEQARDGLAPGGIPKFAKV